MRHDGRETFDGQIYDGPARGKFFSHYAPMMRQVETQRMPVRAFNPEWPPLNDSCRYYTYIWSYSLEAWVLAE